MSPDRNEREARLTAAPIESLHGQSEREGSSHIHSMVRASSQRRLARYAATVRPMVHEYIGGGIVTVHEEREAGASKTLSDAERQRQWVEASSHPSYWSNDAGNAAVLLLVSLPGIALAAWFLASVLGSFAPLVSHVS